jgi:hypothetical protein
MTLAPASGGEHLKALPRDRHQIRHPGQVPVSVRYLGMADIGRERGHGVVDIGAAIMPELNPSANERVPEVVNANLGVTTTGGPAQTGAKFGKHLVDSPLRKLLPRR